MAALTIWFICSVENDTLSLVLKMSFGSQGASYTPWNRLRSL